MNKILKLLKWFLTETNSHHILSSFIFEQYVMKLILPIFVFMLKVMQKLWLLLCIHPQFRVKKKHLVWMVLYDLRRLVQNCTFMCNSPVWCFINIFWKFLIFFWYSNGTKENPRTFFFSLNQKFRKAKNKMCILIISIEI